MPLLRVDAVVVQRLDVTAGAERLPAHAAQNHKLRPSPARRPISAALPSGAGTAGSEAQRGAGERRENAVSR